MIRALRAFESSRFFSSRGTSALALGVIAFAASGCAHHARAHGHASDEAERPEPAPDASSPAKAESAAPEPVTSESARTAGGAGFGSSGPEGLSAGGMRRGALIRLGKVVVDSGYDEEITRRILRQNHGRYRLCFEGTSLDEAQGSMSFSIRVDGGVDGAKASFSGAKPELAACLEKALVGLSFPAPKGPVSVSVNVLYVADPSRPKAPEPVARFVEPLSSPFALTIDGKSERYLIVNMATEKEPVSLMNFEPEGKKPAGTLLTDQGTSKAGAKVTLEEPEALLVIGDTLYVGDGPAVRLFSLGTVEPKTSSALEGVQRVLGLYPLPDGRALALGHDGRLGDSPPEVALYAVDGKGKAKLLARENFPNVTAGAVVDKKLWLGSGDGELFTLNEKFEPVWVMRPLPGGVLLVSAVPGGILLVGRVAEGEAISVLTGPVGGPYRTVAEGIPAAIDVAWDSRRSRLVVIDEESKRVVVYGISLAPAK